MEVELAPGSYVIAVSGGVDSVVLLDLLAKQYESLVTSRQSSVETSDMRLETRDRVRLIVAHFDHGIRPDSADDRRLVQQLAKTYGLPFVYGEGRLGAAASEAAARQARYAFLHQTRRSAGARAVITAHHQDDVLETAIINLLRGTGRRGLSALASRPDVVRPLLHQTKQQLLEYAQKQQLNWHEDSTNQDTRYLRNHVRRQLLPRFDSIEKQQLLGLIQQVAATNRLLDTQLVNYLHLQPAARQLDRRRFIQLPHAVAREVMAGWLRHQGIVGFDRRMLERLVVAAKTGRSGSRVDIMHGHWLLIQLDRLTLQPAKQ